MGNAAAVAVADDGFAWAPSLASAGDVEVASSEGNSWASAENPAAAAVSSTRSHDPDHETGSSQQD